MRKKNWDETEQRQEENVTQFFSATDELYLLKSALAKRNFLSLLELLSFYFFLLSRNGDTIKIVKMPFLSSFHCFYRCVVVHLGTAGMNHLTRTHTTSNKLNLGNT
jgi:hypothetical protein